MGGDTCRHFLPHFPTRDEPAIELFFNKHGDVYEMVLKKFMRISSIYFAEFNPIVVGIMMCNSMLTYVRDPNVGFYLTEYSTKYQAKTKKESNALQDHLLKYFRRNLPTEEKKDETGNIVRKTAFQKGLGLLSSGIYHNVGDVVVGAPMASHYNLKGDRFIFTCGWAYIIFNQVISYLSGGKQQVTLDIQNRNVERLTRYIYRHIALQTLNLWSFSEKFDLILLSDLPVNIIQELTDNNGVSLKKNIIVSNKDIDNMIHMS